MRTAAAPNIVVGIDHYLSVCVPPTIQLRSSGLICDRNKIGSVLFVYGVQKIEVDPANIYRHFVCSGERVGRANNKPVCFLSAGRL